MSKIKSNFNTNQAARKAALVLMVQGLLAKATEQDSPNPSVVFDAQRLFAQNGIDIIFPGRKPEFMSQGHLVAGYVRRQISFVLGMADIRNAFGDWVIASLPETVQLEVPLLVLTRVSRTPEMLGSLFFSTNTCVMVDDDPAKVNASYSFTPVALMQPTKKHKGVWVMVDNTVIDRTFKTIQKAIKAVGEQLASMGPEEGETYLASVRVFEGFDDFALVTRSKKQGKKSISAVKTKAGWLDLVNPEVLVDGSRLFKEPKDAEHPQDEDKPEGDLEQGGATANLNSTPVANTQPAPQAVA